MYGDTYKAGLDAYTVAFSVPDFMFFLLVSGALSVIFVPVFTDNLVKNQKKQAWRLSSSMINFMAVITLVTSVLIMLFADVIINIMMPAEFGEARRNLAISMMRVIAVNPFLFAIATVIASIQQAFGRFVFFALAPTLYNIGIIIGALVFTEGVTLFGVEIFEGGIMGVALGVVLGAILQLVASTIGLLGLGFDYDFKIYWKEVGFIKALKLLPVRSLDQAMDYIVGLVELRLAGGMSEGTVRAYQQALSLHNMPVNLIGVAISTAAFPSMSAKLSAGHIHKFREELQNVLRAIIWLALPVTMIAYFGRGYVVSFIKNGGDTLIAGLLGALALAILFRTIYHIAARTFYAQQDTKTPLYISLVSILLHVGLAFWFVKSLNFGAYGLAYAHSIVSFVEVIILFAIIQVRVKGGVFDSKFMGAITKMLSATGFTAIVTYYMVQLLQFRSDDLSLSLTIPKFVAITLVSFAVYVGLCGLMKLQESDIVLQRLRKIILRGDKNESRKN